MGASTHDSGSHDSGEFLVIQEKNTRRVRNNFQDEESIKAP